MVTNKKHLTFRAPAEKLLLLSLADVSNIHSRAGMCFKNLSAFTFLP
jgi:hypothetical protein